MKRDVVSVTGSHLDSATLERFAARELTAEEIREVEEHLGACVLCATLARDRARGALSALSEEFAREVPAPLEHPDKLASYARGHLDPVERELIVSHLDECATCAAIVAKRRSPWIAAAAAAVVLIALSVLLWPRHATPTSPVPRGAGVPPARRAVGPPPMQAGGVAPVTSEWDSLVREARESGKLALPEDLRELRRDPDVVRGSNSTAGALSPTGEVVGDARPTFSWPAHAAATYVVFVYDGESEIARSGVLHDTLWRPRSALPRGRLLTWQVEAMIGERIETLPRPPAPPAVFRIAQEKDLHDIARARAARPRDPLLLGILYARAGMLDEAAASLRRAAPTDPAARKLLDDLKRVE